MAEENLDFIVRLLFPDAKVPPIDTSEAQAAIAKLQALAKSAQATVTGSVAGMATAVGAPAVAAASSAPMTGYGFNAPYTMARGPGGAAVFSYPTPSTTPAPTRGAYAYAAGPGFASGGSGINWANNAPGVGNWSMSGGSWSQGPIRDPGSHASASLSTARGYDVGMLRQSLDGLQLDTYEQGLQKLRMGMSQVRESTTGLAASVILLNKAFQEGRGFDNPWTMAIGGMGVASHGMNLANGLGRGLQGGATMGANVARSMGWGGTAGQLGGLAAMSGGGMAALVGIPAAITAGAFYLAPGGFRDTWAEQDRQDALGTGLDRRRTAFWDQRTRRTMSGIANTSYAASGISSDAS